MSRNTLLVLGIIAAGVIFLPGYSKLQRLRAHNRDLTKQIQELEKDNDRLSEQIDQLENDPFYIEKKAREKMGVSKKGELIYKVVTEAEEKNIE